MYDMFVIVILRSVIYTLLTYNIIYRLMFSRIYYFCVCGEFILCWMTILECGNIYMFCIQLNRHLSHWLSSRHLMLFGHLVRTDTRRILSVPLCTALCSLYCAYMLLSNYSLTHSSEGLEKASRTSSPSWLATVKNDLSSHNLCMKDATKLALDRPLWNLLTAKQEDLCTEHWCIFMQV